MEFDWNSFELSHFTFNALPFPSPVQPKLAPFDKTVLYARIMYLRYGMFLSRANAHLQAQKCRPMNRDELKAFGTLYEHALMRLDDVHLLATDPTSIYPLFREEDARAAVGDPSPEKSHRGMLPALWRDEKDQAGRLICGNASFDRTSDGDHILDGHVWHILGVEIEPGSD
jgi:hypothetical protein